MGIRDYIQKRKLEHKLDKSNYGAEQRLQAINEQNKELELKRKIQTEQAKTRELKRNIAKGRFAVITEAIEGAKKVTGTISPKASDNLRKKVKGKKKQQKQEQKTKRRAFGEGINPAFGMK